MSKIPVNLTHGYVNQNPKCRGKWPQKGSWPLESVESTSNNSNLKLNLALFFGFDMKRFIEIISKVALLFRVAWPKNTDSPTFVASSTNKRKKNVVSLVSKNLNIIF